MQLGAHHSLETREKMRLAHIGKPHPKRGYPHSQETKEKMRQALLGRPKSFETRARMSRAASERPRGPLTSEHKEKLRQAHLGVSNPAFSHLGRSHSAETRAKCRQARLRQTFLNRLTSIECDLRDEFLRRGLAFEMHKSMFGRYQPDFVFEEARLIVQADGDYWHNLPNARERDHLFNCEAAIRGWSVARFWEQDIIKSAERCGQAIATLVGRRQNADGTV